MYTYIHVHLLPSGTTYHERDTTLVFVKYM